ncbi:peptidase [Thraustotheca clavata]|uniref:Peptidase n=1 Tax=Thraustotheca clavata TaxID=74557 RepID=A0A1W0A415_9STRA|nr:peptidase [Thraustotheca clavata]
MMRKWFIVAAIAGIVDACTVIAVTKGATVDGASLTAHTDDAGWGAADIRLVHVPAMNHSVNSTRPVYEFNQGYPRLVVKERGPHYQPKEGEVLAKPLGYIPQVQRTYAYFDQDYGMINEVQLSIAESTCSAKTVGWPSNLPYGYNLFGIAELSKLALERCDSARCAIQTMGDAAVKYGFYSEDSGDPAAPVYGDSAESLAIADKYGETWVFHVLTGPKNSSAVWAAQRVPDGHVTAVANFFTIREMNLTDKDNFLASDNILSFAQEMQWWKPEDGIFDFAKAYAYAVPGPILSLYAGRRIWRILDSFAPSLHLDSTLGCRVEYPTYPFSVVPDSPVNIEQVMELLKDHYEGTPYDMTKGIAAGPFNTPVRYDGPRLGKGGWERAISMYRTMFSFVLQVRGTKFPDAFGATFWFGQSTPHGTIYIPYSCAQSKLPESYLIGKQSEFNTESMWWAFDFVNNWSQLRFNVINAEVRQEAKKWQTEAFANQNELLKAPKSKVTLEALEQLNNDFGNKVFKAWWAFAWKLVGKYSDGYITTGEAPQEMQVIGYPTEWLNATDYVNWPGNTFAQSSGVGSILLYISLGVCIGIFVMSRFPRRREYFRLP